MIPELGFVAQTTWARHRALAVASGLVVLSFLFGGQSVYLTLVQAIPQLAAVLAIAWWGWTHRRGDLQPGTGPLIALAGLLAAIVAAQLLPLPYGWWTAPSDRAFAVSVMHLVDKGTPWHALSLDPSATAQSALTLLPALALLLIGLRLDRAALAWLVLVLIGCATASLLLGWLQVTAGIQSPLYVYGDPRDRLSLGLFANRNHQADALCLATLASGVALYRFGPRFRLVRERLLPSALAICAIFGLGVVSTASRTGLFLFLPCAVLTIATAWHDSRVRPVTRGTWLIACAIVVLALALGWAGLGQVASRLQATRDLRFVIWPDAWYLAKSVWPVGTGFGTFELAYQRIESLAGVSPLLVNAAHSDWLQLAIEGGAPAIAGAMLFLGWLVWQAIRLVRYAEGMAGWFAFAGIWVLLLHSAVDYPLRTEALSTTLVLLCVIVNAASHPAPRAGRHLEVQSIDLPTGVELHV
jgi:hypothetical protein